MADTVTDQVSYLLAKIAWQLDTQAKGVVATAGLSIEQWRILVLLQEQGGRSMSDLAQQALVEAATLTKMIDRLVSDAMVYRAPDVRDRRRVLIFPSAKAQSCVERLRPLLAAQDARVADRLGSVAVAALRSMASEGERPREPAETTGRRSSALLGLATAAE